MCHRPFWPSSYAHDVDEEYGGGDSGGAGGAGGGGGGGGFNSRHFTSSDYFKLLHSTEQAADATRAVHRNVRENGGADGENKGEPRSRAHRRGRAEQRGSVEIVEELPDSTPPPAARTRSRFSATAAAAASASGTHERDIPIVQERSGRTSRAGAGMRIRRQQQQLGASGSVVDLTGLADEANAMDGEEEEFDDTASTTSSAAAAAGDGGYGEEVEDDVLACGLHRSSFNSGYYAKFFREECKLGAGGVGGVYLTHHVLDNVMLGTYAVKKIPVGNSRPWLLQVLKEVRALEGLHHRHIIAYKHSWLEEAFKPSDFGPAVPCLFLLMEYANRGTLANLIWPKVKAGTGSSAAAAARSSRLGQVPPPHVMQEEDVWWVFIGTCLGLRHLHRAGVIHVSRSANTLTHLNRAHSHVKCR